LEYSNLFDFVIKSTKSDEHAFCTVCSADFSIVHGRRNDITQHAGTIKHAHGAGRSIASFFWQWWFQCDMGRNVIIV